MGATYHALPGDYCGALCGDRGDCRGEPGLVRFIPRHARPCRAESSDGMATELTAAGPGCRAGFSRAGDYFRPGWRTASSPTDAAAPPASALLTADTVYRNRAWRVELGFIPTKPFIADGLLEGWPDHGFAMRLTPATRMPTAMAPAFVCGATVSKRIPVSEELICLWTRSASIFTSGFFWRARRSLSAVD